MSHATLLDPRREKFCSFVAQGWPIYKAYVTAGFSGGANATRLMKDENIINRIENLVSLNRDAERSDIEKVNARLHLTQERILREYSYLAFSRMENYLTPARDGFDLSQCDEEQLAAIQEITFETTATGVKQKIKLYDKKGPLDNLARHLGLTIAAASAAQGAGEDRPVAYVNIIVQGASAPPPPGAVAVTLEHLQEAGHVAPELAPPKSAAPKSQRAARRP